MTYTISNIKKFFFITLLVSFSLFSANAGTNVSVTRGNTATISWNVNNAQCRPSVPSYSSADDTIKSNWENGQAGSGSYSGIGTSNFGGQKVTAATGTYNFDCIVPAEVGGCAGDTSGIKGTCWDSAVLTVNDCMPGSAWVASSLSCQVQVCIANTQTTYGCSQTSIGDVTHTCNSTGTDATGACTLTSCPGGAVISAGTCVCPAGQNMISVSCVAPSLAYFNVMPGSCSIANGASSCPMTLSWSVNGSTGTTIKDCNGTGSTF